MFICRNAEAKGCMLICRNAEGVHGQRKVGNCWWRRSIWLIPNFKVNLMLKKAAIWCWQDWPQWQHCARH